MFYFVHICRGCPLVRQCFFHNDPRNSIGIGGGVVGCRGFHSSFRATQAGLSLNMGITQSLLIQLYHDLQLLLLMDHIYYLVFRCVNNDDSQARESCRLSS